MWIMLREKLPVDGSPPKLSIHWSIDGVDVDKTIKQFKTFYRNMLLKKTFRKRDTYLYPTSTEFLSEKLKNFYFTEDLHPYSPEQLNKKIIEFMRQKDDVFVEESNYKHNNWAKARWIQYNEKNIRVFAREYSIMDKENMYLCLGLLSEGPSHYLVPARTAHAKKKVDLLEGSMKDTYDTALVDGATHEQATAMALGLDVTNLGELSDLPVTGWYRIYQEYGLEFCTEEELHVEGLDPVELHGGF